jgi:hypothetical protein
MWQNGVTECDALHRHVVGQFQHIFSLKMLTWISYNHVNRGHKLSQIWRTPVVVLTKKMLHFIVHMESSIPTSI